MKLLRHYFSLAVCTALPCCGLMAFVGLYFQLEDHYSRIDYNLFTAHADNYRIQHEADQAILLMKQAMQDQHRELMESFQEYRDAQAALDGYMKLLKTYPEGTIFESGTNYPVFNGFQLKVIVENTYSTQNGAGPITLDLKNHSLPTGTRIEVTASQSLVQQTVHGQNIRASIHKTPKELAQNGKG
jgi:hypothetical protein